MCQLFMYQLTQCTDNPLSLLPVGLLQILSHCHNWHPLGYAHWVHMTQWVMGKTVTLSQLLPIGLTHWAKVPVF